MTQRVRWSLAATKRNESRDDWDFDEFWATTARRQTIADDLYTNGEDELTGHVMACEIRRAIASFPRRDAAMIRQWSMGWTFEEIATMHGLTEQRVGQIVNGAIGKLRARLA